MSTPAALVPSAKHVFTHNDKRYEVSGLTQNIKAQYPKELFSLFRDRAKKAHQEGVMSGAEYEKYSTKLMDDYLMGDLAIDGIRGSKTMLTKDGMSVLCSLMFGISKEEMLDLLLDRSDDIASLIRMVIEESQVQVKEEEVGEKKGEEQELKLFTPLS